MVEQRKGRSMLIGDAKKPYKGYTLYKVFHKKEKRYYAILVKTRIDRTSVAWAKYLAEVKIGRRLGRKWHVHHKDQIKTHDVLRNLKVCTPKIHGQQHRKTHRWVMHAKCSVCKVAIDKIFRGVRSIFGEKQYHYCSRQCVYASQRSNVRLYKSKANCFMKKFIECADNLAV